MQLNAICRLARFIGSKENMATIKSFVYPIFNSCLPVWHFYSCESLQKKKKEKEKEKTKIKISLRLVLDDYESNYGNLIKKNGTTTMKVNRLRTLVTKIFKTINNINPSYMKNMFTPKTKAINTTTRYHSQTL